MGTVTQNSIELGTYVPFYRGIKTFDEFNELFQQMYDKKLFPTYKTEHCFDFARGYCNFRDLKNVCETCPYGRYYNDSMLDEPTDFDMYKYWYFKQQAKCVVNSVKRRAY